MARSNVPTLLPLNRYATLMDFSLAHFCNLDDGRPASATTPYWNQARHDELAGYIAEAEAGLLSALAFPVAPTFIEERIRFLPDTTDWYRWVRTEARTTFQHVQAFGRRVNTALAENATVTLGETTASITVTNVPDGTTVDEIRAYYRVADGAPAAADDCYRIAPRPLTLTGATAAISGPRALFAKLSVLEGETPAAYDSDSNFVTGVDVYRVHVDESLPVSLVWDTFLNEGGGDPSVETTQTGTAWTTNLRRGAFRPRPAIYESGAHVYQSPTYGQPPDFLDVAYLAGYPLRAGRIDARLELAVARLANVLSPTFAVWIADLAKTRWRYDRDMPNEDNPLQEAELKNPFGFTNGARFAWRIVQEMRLPMTSEAMAV